MPVYIFDDIYGNQRPGAPEQVPVYLPASGQWDPLGGTCPQCTLKTNLPIPIDPTRAQNGTWHTMSMNPEEPVTTISITFTGTGITAYCMLPPFFNSKITSHMNMTFELDGQLVTSYERVATTNEWTYDYPVFNITGIENKEHTFVIQPQGGKTNSYMVFDYFAYEYEEFQQVTSQSSSPSPTTSATLSSTGISYSEPQTTSPTFGEDKSHNTTTSKSAIVGGVLGDILVLVVLILSLRYRHQRRNAVMTESAYRQPMQPYPQIEGVIMETRRAHIYSTSSLLPTLIDEGSSSVTWPTTANRLSTAGVENPQNLRENDLRRIDERRVGQKESGVLASANGQQLQRVHGQVENLLTVLENLNMAWRRRVGDLEQQGHPEPPPPSYRAAIESSPPTDGTAL